MSDTGEPVMRMGLVWWSERESESCWLAGDRVSGAIEAAEVSSCVDLLQGHNRCQGLDCLVGEWYDEVEASCSVQTGRVVSGIPFELRSGSTWHVDVR